MAKDSRIKIKSFCFGCWSGTQTATSYKQETSLEASARFCYLRDREAHLVYLEL